jgi:hypothetical protein
LGIGDRKRLKAKGDGMKTIVALTMLLTVGVLAFGQGTPKPEDVLNEKQVAIELAKLRQMTPANKQKLRDALDALHEAFLTATVSTDTDEIAKGGNKAKRAVDAAELVIPNGVLKGTLISCDKALGHSYILRLVNSGDMDPTEPRVAQLLQEIMLRYQLARIPSYERPAKILDYAELHLTIANEVAFRAGIISKKPKLSSTEPMPNKSLDASGGSVFLNMTGAAKVE